MKQNLAPYKAVLILDTRGREETADALIESLKAEFAAVQATVNAVENLGQRNLARVTDKNFPAAVYASYSVEAAVGFPAAFKERVRLNKLVYRVFIEKAA